jgi:hypothetical protein
MQSAGDFVAYFGGSVLRLPVTSITKISETPYLQTLAVEYRDGSKRRSLAIRTPEDDLYHQLFSALQETLEPGPLRK